MKIALRQITDSIVKKKINLTIAFKKGNSCHITLTIYVKHLLSSGTLDNT